MSYTYKLIYRVLQNSLVSFFERELTDDEMHFIKDISLSLSEKLSEELGYIK